MKIICTVEGCGHLSENRDIGLCATHAREARKKAAPKAKPARKRIARISDKMRKDLVLYADVRKEFLEANPICSVHGNGCKATSIHHVRGRGKYLTDKRYFLSVCEEGHRFIHDNPQTSFENGWMQSRIV